MCHPLVFILRSVKKHCREMKDICKDVRKVCTDLKLTEQVTVGGHNKYFFISLHFTQNKTTYSN